MHTRADRSRSRNHGLLGLHARLAGIVVRPLPLAVLAFAGAGLAMNAWAIPAGSGSSCYTEGHVKASGATPEENWWFGGCSGIVDRKGQVDVIVQAETTDVHTFNQAALTSASASAGLGTLHANSLSRGSSSPMQYIYITPNGGTGVTPNNYVALADSRASAEWHDEFRVQHAEYSLAPIPIRLTVTLSGSATALAAGKDAGISANLYMQNDRNLDAHYVSLDHAGTVVVETAWKPSWNYRLQGVLSVFSEVAAGHACNALSCPPLPAGYVSYAEAFADASNTAGFYIEVLEAGASLTTASGFSYTAPVPEPGSAWLFGVGVLVALAGVDRSRRLPPS